MEEIIEKYSSLTEGSDYVLPILHSNISRDLQEQYYNALRYQNAQLKKIEKWLNIPHLHLTTYVPRHKWEYYKNSTVYIWITTIYKTIDFLD